MSSDRAQYAPGRWNRFGRERSGRSSTGTTGSSRSTCSTRCCGAGRRGPSRCSTTSPALQRAAGIKLPPISGAQFADGSAPGRGDGPAAIGRGVRDGGGDAGPDRRAAGHQSRAGTPTIRRCSTRLATAELAAEADALVADRELLALVREQAEAGRRMVVVSDTYLGPGHLASLLSGRGISRPTRSSGSSCPRRTGCRSRSGLFEAVVDELDIHPTRLLHVGDNVGADVTPLRDLGGRSARWSIARDEAIEMTIREAGHGLRSAVDRQRRRRADGRRRRRDRAAGPPGPAGRRHRTARSHPHRIRAVRSPRVRARARRTGQLDLHPGRRARARAPLLLPTRGRSAGRARRPGRRRREPSHCDTGVLAVSRAALAPARYPTVGRRLPGRPHLRAPAPAGG